MWDITGVNSGLGLHCFFLSDFERKRTVENKRKSKRSMRISVFDECGLAWTQP